MKFHPLTPTEIMNGGGFNVLSFIVIVGAGRKGKFQLNFLGKNENYNFRVKIFVVSQKLQDTSFELKEN